MQSFFNSVYVPGPVITSPFMFPIMQIYVKIQNYFSGNLLKKLATDLMCE